MPPRISSKRRNPTRRIASVDEIPETHRIVCWVYSNGKTRIMCAPKNPRSKTMFPRVYTLVPERDLIAALVNAAEDLKERLGVPVVIRSKHNAGVERMRVAGRPGF